jgi:hypothetical protein
MTSINDILKKLDSTEQTLMSTVVDTKDNENNPPESPSTPLFQREAEGDFKGGKGGFEVQKDKDTLWSETIERLKSKDHLLAYKLAFAKIINITNTELTIGFNGGMSVFVDSVKKNTALVETAVKDITGNKLRLKIVSLPVEDLPAGRQGSTLREEKKSINEINPIREISNGVKEEIFSNPVVKNVIELFNGTLLEVKSLKKNDYTD